MPIKRLLIMTVPFLILAWIAARLGRGMDRGDESFWFYLLMGGLWIAHGIWRAQVDRFLRPKQPLDEGWGYQWMRALFICIGIGMIANALIDLVLSPGDPRISAIFLMLALAFLLNPLIYAVAVRRSGEPAHLHDVLTTISAGLVGPAILVLIVIDAVTRHIGLEAFLVFVPSLVLIIAADLVSRSSWRNDQSVQPESIGESEG
jgi:hypothetical protein